ncbi:hypothetical protein D3C72_1253160 [compost metagenome]
MVTRKQSINPFFGSSHPLQQARLNVAKLHPAGCILGTLLHGDPHRQELRGKIAGFTDGKGYRMGCSVVAGNQAPESAIDDDRHRHRSGRTHIAHIFEMNRRHTAKLRKAHIEHCSRFRIHRRPDRDGLIIDIGNHSQAIDGVELPRLRRDIARRKAKSEIRRQSPASGFRHDMTAPVQSEVIDQRTIITADQRHQLRRPKKRVLQRRRAVQILRQIRKFAHQLFSRLALSCLFDLENNQSPGSMRRNNEFLFSPCISEIALFAGIPDGKFRDERQDCFGDDGTDW